jgi:hypothetical protein
MNFGLNLAAGRLQGIRPAPAVAAAREADRTPAVAVGDMLAKLMPGMETSALRQSIMADLAAQGPADAPVRARAARAVGLALGSPDFQRK